MTTTDTIEPTPTPEKAKRRWVWPVATAAALFIGIGIGGAVGSTDPTAPDVVASPEATAAPAYTPAPKPAAPAYPDPVLTDYVITVYETDKQCFGSAGCNVTFTVDLAYDGPVLDPVKTYELRYEVTGAEDPLLSTLEITGDEYTSSEQYVSTTSESAELTVNVLDIRER
jgi:hypothetical protein